MRLRALVLAVGLSLCAATGAIGRPRDDAPADDQTTSSEPFKDQLLHMLPPSVSDNMELDLWGWIGDLNTSEGNNYWDAELSVGITKSFDQRLTLSAQGNFIGANGVSRAELEQGYASALLSEQSQSLLTIGKFNANFGVEARDFWNRTTGTTSLLFGAQPQDLVGAMLTLPIGDSGVKVRPFISADFQGSFYFDQPPSAGVMVEYRPNQDWSLALTNWVGPGFVLFGGEPLHSPYNQGAYGTAPDSVVENWQGPNLFAQRDGTLYFVEAKAVWRMFPDLTLSTEYLRGTTWSSIGQCGWEGWMALVDYDITNRLHVYGRFSYLNDPDWLITGFFQTARETSAGFGYDIVDNVEFRAEYRHDFSNANPDIDIVSVHLTFTY